MKKIIGWVLVAVLMVAIPWVYASVVKDSMTFEGPLTILNSITQTGNQTVTGNLTVTGNTTQTGNIGVTGNVVVDGGYIRPEVYTRTSAQGALTWDVSYGNVLITSGTTPLTITLPQITTAMAGYEFTIINHSGATTRTVASYGSGYDTIESTLGTITGTSDANNDAAGDTTTWMAMPAATISGTSAYWKLIDYLRS